MTNLYTLFGVEDGTADAPFAQLPSGDTVSYGALAERSACYANALARSGVRRGDRVAIQVEKCFEMILVYLATLRLGAVFLPLNPAYTLPELNHILADAEPALLICSEETAAELARTSAAGGPSVATMTVGGSGSLPRLAASCPPIFQTLDLDEDCLAAILYTSGTTGKPKGAMLSHGNLASNALALRELWAFTDRDVLLHALPIFHTHGLFVGTNVTLAARASMIFMPRFLSEEVVAALPRATVMMGVPTFYIRLLAEPRFDRAAVAAMRLFISGSAPLSADVHRQFEARTGHAILERYGMTETNMNTSNPYRGERRAGTVGFPLPGIDVRVTGPQGDRLAPGEVGMIEIAGPNVFKGYWSMPEKTAEEFRGAYFVSGDLGRFDSDGYLHIVGRNKDLIISGGFNVYPAEVEAALDDLPQVAESAVIGVSHPDLGEAVLAVVAASDPSFRDAEVLLKALSDSLARYKQPRRLLFVDQLPRNTMGKIQKNALRETYSSLFEPAAE